MCCSLLIYRVYQNVVFPIWKLLAYVCQLEISGILLCLMLVLNIATVFPLDVYQLPVLSVEVLVGYNEGKLFVKIY